MELCLIHADASMNELCEVCEFESFSAELSLDVKNNDWELEMSEGSWSRCPIEAGHYIYVEGTEWGGPVERVRHTAANETVRVSGSCWRGLLERHVVCPLAGQTHAAVSGEANSVVRSLLGGWRSELFSVSTEQSPVALSGRLRYTPLLEGIYDMLADAGGRLCAVFSDGALSLSVLPERDMSEEIEFSQDYDAQIVSDERMRVYNHILALGRGEMLERDVAELWITADGGVTGDGQSDGVAALERIDTLLYDYPSVESSEELVRAARKKLLAASGESAMEVKLSGISAELELSDVVSAKDSVTGMSATLRVTAKELSITKSGVSITHTLG